MGDVLVKVPVSEQDPKVRATNFEEVCLGYNKEEKRGNSQIPKMRGKQMEKSLGQVRTRKWQKMR